MRAESREIGDGASENDREPYARIRRMVWSMWMRGANNIFSAAEVTRSAAKYLELKRGRRNAPVSLYHGLPAPFLHCVRQACKVEILHFYRRKYNCPARLLSRQSPPSNPFPAVFLPLKS